MAKRARSTKTTKTQVDEDAKGVSLPNPKQSAGVVALPDSVFLKSCSMADKKAGKTGLFTEVNMECIPFPSFCMRYLTHLTGFPLRRVVVVVGKKASYKSTFVGEVCRWFRWGGGGGSLIETERKLQRALIQAVTAYDPAACQMRQVTSLDDAQKMLHSYADQFMKDTPDKNVPGVYCVDSIASAQKEATQKKIDKDQGATGPRFATEAQAIKDWLNRITAKTLAWPVSYVLVNHVSHIPIEGTMYGIERKSPGGKHIGYQEALELEFTRAGGATDKPVRNPFSLELYMQESGEDPGFYQIPLKIAVYKNSDGVGSRRINVNAYYWYTKEISKTGREFSKQWFSFDWHSATVDLLLGNDWTPPSKAADIRVRSAGGGRPKTFWTPVLGMTSEDAVTAHELGAMIEKDNDLQEALILEYKIQAYPYIQSSVDFLSQVPGYEYVADMNDRLTEISHEQNAELEIGGVIVDNTLSARNPTMVGSSGLTSPPPREVEENEWEAEEAG